MNLFFDKILHALGYLFIFKIITYHLIYVKTVEEYRVSGQSLIIHNMKINKLDSWLVRTLMH